MSKDVMKIELTEVSVAAATTSMQGFIDDMWDSIDVNHTPSSIELNVVVFVTVSNSVTSKTFALVFIWYEDASVQKTRMKNIFAAFTAGITAMEGASSYTTVSAVTVRGTMAMVWA